MNTQDIVDNQISAQIENRVDVEVVYTKRKNMEDYIRLYEKKGVYFLGLRAVEKPISKAEYLEILDMIQEDHFGNKSIVIAEDYNWFWDRYFNFRDGDKLEKTGKALFGNSWKKALALALNVDERRMTHWTQCTRPVPPSVWDDLKKIVLQRQAEIDAIKDDLGLNASDYLNLAKEDLHKKANKNLGL